MRREWDHDPPRQQLKLSKKLKKAWNKQFKTLSLSYNFKHFSMKKLVLALLFIAVSLTACTSDETVEEAVFNAPAQSL